MERRSYRRKSVDVSVYLSDTGHPPRRCVATDISAAGIFLKTNPLFVPTNKRLNLMFALHISTSNLVRLRRVPAIVTRSEHNGVGMRFCESSAMRPSSRK